MRQSPKNETSYTQRMRQLQVQAQGQKPVTASLPGDIEVQEYKSLSQMTEEDQALIMRLAAHHKMQLERTQQVEVLSLDTLMSAALK